MTRPRQTGRRAEGFALIAVTWIVVIAGLILMGTRRSARVNLAGAYNELASVRAHWLSRAGIEQAIAILEDDYTDMDSALDSWYEAPDCFEQGELAGGEFSLAAPPGEGSTDSC